MLTCRVFPNGEFSLWEQRKTVEISPPPVQPDYLGLSLLPISHRVALGIAEKPPGRAKRGSRGISRHGARMVRNGAFLLEKKYGIDCLTFLTCTLPPLSATDEFSVALEWAELVRVFVQSVGRLLKAAGLPASYVGCTEIQGKRYQERGGMPLHLHLVFPGRHPRGRWLISSDQFRELWRRSVVGRNAAYESVSFAASVDTQRVKKSTQGYLGKYMSKGPGQISSMTEEDQGIAEFLPSSWWHCSLNLRRAIGKRVTGGCSTALKIRREIRQSPENFKYVAEVKGEMKDGAVVVLAIVGVLSPVGRKKHAYSEAKSPVLCKIRDEMLM